MQVTSKEEIFKPYLCLFSGSKVVCLDNRFCVVSCEGSLLESGECVLKSVRETVPEPLGIVMDTTLYKNEHFYCLRLHPIKNGKHAANLRYGMVKAKDYTRLTEVLGIETAMSNLSSVCENAFNYAEMLYRTQRETVVDAGELCENLAKRCNAALAKCGRRIEALIEPGSLYIYADSRRAVVALVNAVQNALLYSPKETEPILTVCYRESRGRKFVEIRVVNESSMFSSKDFSGSVDVNFSYQRMGYGIPIIKRFAQVSGGWFDMTEENGRVTVTISLPAAHYGSGAELPLRKPSAAQYDTGIPDFTEIMMREVVQFFGESAESAE